MANRFIDWLRNLTAKSTTIDGSEQVHLDSSGLSQKATTKDLVSYVAQDLAQTWNAGSTVFTALKMNVTDTASSASSLLMDLQVGGVSRAYISKGGYVSASGMGVSGSITAGGNASGCLTTGIGVASSVQVLFSSTTACNGAPDSGLKRDSAGVVKITDGSTGTGKLIFIVPTTNPGIAGALWNNAGTLSISAG